MNARKMGSREVREMLASLEERFGFDPKVFEEYDFFVNQKDKVFIINKAAAAAAGTYEKRLLNSGMLFARRDAVVKPTSNTLQVFGKSARKNFIDLNKVRARIYVEGFDVDFRGQEVRASDGYVVLRYEDYNLGCGLLKESQLKNMMPKAKRMRLQYL